LWVFSTDACGTFGLPEWIIRKSGLARPIGEIVLTSSRKNVKLPAGTGLLLQVAHWEGKV